MVETVHVDDQEFQEIPGGLRAAFLQSADEVQLAVARADSGDGEKWHRHNDDVEEIYYTVSGRGRITWKSDGREHETEVGPGESALLEKGGLEHEIEAIGSEPWEFVVAINDPGSKPYSDIFDRYGSPE